MVDINDVTPLIIGIVGNKNSGKTYISKFLVETYGFERLIIAEKLLFILEEKFGLLSLNDKRLINVEFYINILKNDLIYYAYLKDCLKFVGIDNIDVVKQGALMQLKRHLIDYHITIDVDRKEEMRRACVRFFALDICRSVDDEIWIKELDSNVNSFITRLKRRIVIEDIRFKNEFDYVTSLFHRYRIKTITVGVSAVKKNQLFKKVSDSVSDISDMINRCDTIIENDYTYNFNANISKFVKFALL